MHPDFDFFSIFVQGLSSKEVLVTILGFISAIAFASLWLTRLGRIILPQPNESKVADFLPFNKLMSDGMTIRCYNGSYARVFQIEGLDLNFATEEKIASMASARKAWLDGLSDLQVTARVITLRERVPADVIENTFNNKLLENVAYTWQSTLSRVYNNSHYIVISVPDRPEALKDLNYASQSLLATLSEYGVRAMFEGPDSSPLDSPFHIFSRLCSPLSNPDPKVGNTEGSQLNEMLTADQIHFTGENGLIKFKSGDEEMLAITMGIRTSGDYMDESMIVSLLAIDCELTLLHNIKPFYRPSARALLIQQRNMARLTSFSQDVVDQYEYAMSSIEDSDTNYQALSQYAMSLVLKGRSKEEIDFAESEVQRICRLFGVTPVREGWVCQATFFNQFPTYDTYPRTYLYLSRVVTAAICFDKPADRYPRYAQQKPYAAEAGTYLTVKVESVSRIIPRGP